MKEVKRASAFSNTSEYEAFKEHYCNNCEFHKEDENERCPIEDNLDRSMTDASCFPSVILELWEDGKCTKRHHCPLCEEKNVKQ